MIKLNIISMMIMICYFEMNYDMLNDLLMLIDNNIDNCRNKASIEGTG